MKIRTFWVGKTRQPQCVELIELYWSRIESYTPCERVEVRDNDALVKAGEKEPPNSFTMVLDENGRQFKSSEWAELLRRLQDRSVQELRIYVGDQDGVPESIQSKANMLVSFSAMTLPHDLARVILVEQLYRAMTIIKGHPYSR